MGYLTNMGGVRICSYCFEYCDKNIVELLKLERCVVLWVSLVVLNKPNRFEDAISYCKAQSRSVRTFNPQEIGERYLSYLLQQKLYDFCASRLAATLGPDTDKVPFCVVFLSSKMTNHHQWEKWIYIFFEHKRVAALVPHIPFEDPGFVLHKSIYTLVLTILVRLLVLMMIVFMLCFIIRSKRTRELFT